MRWSPEKVPGVPMRLLHSASAALVVSFAESSRSAAAAVILPVSSRCRHQELAVSPLAWLPWR